MPLDGWMGAERVVGVGVHFINAHVCKYKFVEERLNAQSLAFRSSSIVNLFHLHIQETSIYFYSRWVVVVL